MVEAAETSTSYTMEAAAYTTSWEYIADELRCLDLHLQRQVIVQRPEQSAEPLAPFKGLVLSEAEVVGLLTQTPSPSDGQELQDSSAAESQAIAQAVSRIENEIAARRAASLRAGIYLSLPQLAQLFHLTRFEERCLIICLAPELARKYEKIYAYLQDDATCKNPSVALILSLLCQTRPEELAARAVFAPPAPLLKYHLCNMNGHAADAAVPLLSRWLKLDDRITNFLLGFGQIDARLEAVAQLLSPQAEGSRATRDEEIYSRVRRFVRTHFGKEPLPRRGLIFYFHGPSATGKQSVAEAVCEDLGLPLLSADVEQMSSAPYPFEELVWLLGRELLLQPAALLLNNMDGLLAAADKHQVRLKSLFEAIRTFSQLTFIMGTRPWQPPRKLHEQRFVAVEFKLPDARTARRLWETHLKACEGLGNDEAELALASRFRFPAIQIQEAIEYAKDLADWRSPEDGRVTMADLNQANRALSTPNLGALARKIDARYSWDEIVLPEDQFGQLKELCNQARWRHRVYGDWGFDRRLSLGKGLNALFSGPPGTGKTMAAEVIARELQLDLYQIDLSQVVSKYIGETEKNLHQIFAEAQASNAILFFDEADALFGKRSEIKDSHDRYANIEVGYLLQKMEEYEGIAILATNLRDHLDEAFVRRMQFIVEFPFPSEAYRRRIWEVTFPPEAPLDRDVDVGVLAREIKLAGGNIRNIALAAAFYAAADGGRIVLSHLQQAARREFQKMGRTWDEGGRTVG
jgi:AAA+ superfamily predicted ATPase